MLNLFSCRHNWKSVAIDESFGWISGKGTSKEDTGQHIVRYVECSKCGARSVEYDDADEPSREYARNKHSEVASARAKWIHGGQIEPGKRLHWIDKSRAPMRGFEGWLKQLKQDPEMKDLLAQSMVDDALGQLEVAIKLHVNNTPVKTP